MKVIKAHLFRSSLPSNGVENFVSLQICLQTLNWKGSHHQSAVQEMFLNLCSIFVDLFQAHMGEISQGVRSLILMSYFLFFWAPFFGNLEVCYAQTCNIFWKYMSAASSTCLCLDHSSIGGLFNCPSILPFLKKLFCFKTIFIA